MAMQAGFGFSKIILIVGAGYTGSILIKNGKLSDIIGEIQSLMIKGIEAGEKTGGDSEYADQVRRLVAEVRQLASARQITVLNGGAAGNVSSMLVPAATAGALGYGYMWWKGYSFSDLMYVTKQNMANAVANLTKHLDTVKDKLSSTTEHLSQRILGLDDKMELQNQMSKDIRDSVCVANSNMSKIELDLDSLQNMVYGLDGKIDSLEAKQDFANLGVRYLCNFIDGNGGKMPEALKSQLKVTGGKARGLLKYPDVQGLKIIRDTLFEENGFADDNPPPRTFLLRASSAV
jgi:hypothetical protein